MTRLVVRSAALALLGFVVLVPVAAADAVSDADATIRSSTTGVVEETNKIIHDFWPWGCSPVAINGDPSVTLRPECLVP